MTTTDEQYVPSEDEIREAYVWLSAGDNEGAREQATEDFNRGVARIRCDAYDEGYEDGQHDAHEHRPWRKSVHPYRQEAALDGPEV